MPEDEKKRFIVLFVNKDKKTHWAKEYDTLTEAHEAISHARHKATGYAIHDRELHEFIKFKNFAFEEHEHDEDF
jgi:hypothetical protein